MPVYASNRTIAEIRTLLTRTHEYWVTNTETNETRIKPVKPSEPEYSPEVVSGESLKDYMDKVSQAARERKMQQEQYDKDCESYSSAMETYKNNKAKLHTSVLKLYANAWSQHVSHPKAKWYQWIKMYYRYKEEKALKEFKETFKKEGILTEEEMTKTEKKVQCLHDHPYDVMKKLNPDMTKAEYDNWVEEESGPEPVKAEAPEKMTVPEPERTKLEIQVNSQGNEKKTEPVVTGGFEDWEDEPEDFKAPSDSRILLSSFH